MDPIVIIGGGLAGSEAAWQLTSRGYPVRLFEMRPSRSTPAHKTGNLAELVCSNSLKSIRLDTASGLLKEEMKRLGCFVLTAARTATVPAGETLAVDREVFSETITRNLQARANLTVERREVEALPERGPAVVCTGPLTSESLAESIETHLGRTNLFFYDAIAPSVSADSLDTSKVFKASRYGKGEDDYFNAPLDAAEYDRLIEAILEAEPLAAKEFESVPFFEACLPIEVLARRGRDTLRFGPMKPVGLRDPRSGRRPHAVVQLRQEKKDGTMLGLVGFQTRLKYGDQKRIFRMIPGLEGAEFLRYGSIHRNTFLNSPAVLDERQQDRRIGGLYYAGQLTGVEGYVESTMSGLLAALNIVADLEGWPPVRLPGVTMCGALIETLSTGLSSGFQPLNANYGILPRLDGAPRSKRQRKEAYSRRALKAIDRWIEERPDLFRLTREPLLQPDP